MPNSIVIAVSSNPISCFLKPMTTMVTVAACVLLGCTEDVESSGAVEPQIVTAEDKVVEFSFNANCDGRIRKSVESHWPEKLRRLANLDGQYELITRGAINLDQSLFNEPQTLSERPYLEITLNVSNFEQLMGQMDRAESLFIKGHKDLGGRLYPRATIEEYVFNTRNCAEKAESYLRWIGESVGTRTTRWKDMSRIFRDDQTVYYITGGGAYMSDRMRAIETALKGAEE